MAIFPKEISNYNSPFTDITYNIQNIVSPQNLSKLSMLYDMTSETMNFIIQNNSHLVQLLLDSQKIIQSTYKDKPNLIVHKDYETGEKILFIHINSNIKNHNERFNSKMKLCEKLYKNNKDYNKYFTITFD